jgi:hypothetical protein
LHLHYCIVNEDTGRGKILAINGLSNFILWPGQIVTVLNDNNVWKSSGPYRWKLSGAITINVDQGVGADTNDGLATGSGNALQTDAAAWSAVQNQIDPAGFAVTILHANGPYTTPVNLSGPQAPNSNIIFDGGGQTFNVTGNAFQVFGGSQVTVQNIVLQCTVLCLAAFDPGSKITVAGTFQTNACGTACIFADRLAHIIFNTTYTINGNGTTVFQCSHQGDIRTISQHIALGMTAPHVRLGPAGFFCGQIRRCACSAPNQPGAGAARSPTTGAARPRA